MKKKLIDKLKDFWLWFELVETILFCVLVWALVIWWAFMGILFLDFFRYDENVNQIIADAGRDYLITLFGFAWMLIVGIPLLLFLFRCSKNKKEFKK